MKVLFVRSGNNGRDPITQNQGESLTGIGCDIHFFDILGKGALGYLKNVTSLRRTISRIRPELIHAHYGLCGIVAMLAVPKMPVIISFMGGDVNNGGRFFLILLRLLGRLYWQEVIVKTEGMKRKLGLENAHVIPNGVDLGTFIRVSKRAATTKLGWSENKKNILFGSDPARPEKNHALFEKAMRLLKDGTIDFDIHYLKGIPRKQVLLHYNAADVLVLTSHKEGSPNVIKEAMACGCPIVATDVGDVRELIQSISGCFMADFDEFDVARKIKMALDYGGRTNGRDQIAHLDSRIIANKILEVYLRALGLDL